jgi:hypothetical protein
LILALILVFTSTSQAAQWTEKVLYSFQGSPDGAVPAGGVVFDKSGSLYGATTYGNQYGELGTVYELSPPAKKGDPWTESLIYSFLGKTGYNDGMIPVGGLVIDNSGNLYGTTAYGGTGGCILLGILYGCGTVYELSPPQQKGEQWTETILYSFQSGNDGYFPWGDLTFDKAGNLYGATDFGGGKGNTCNPYYGGNCGTVFKLSPPKQKGGQWTEHVLHSFAGGHDGANPNGGLAIDAHSAVYGTTFYGGYLGGFYCQKVGCGTVFRLDPPRKKGGTWTEKRIHTFKDGNDSVHPLAGMIFGTDGRLYGTTFSGGTVFSLAPPSRKSGRWKETILYTFGGGNGDIDPQDALLFDTKGNLYGTASYGGQTSGEVFQMTPPRRKGGAWTFHVVYGFPGPPDGAIPSANLIFDKQGNLYSTTMNGGTGTACQFGCGTVFEVSP